MVARRSSRIFTYSNSYVVHKLQHTAIQLLDSSKSPRPELPKQPPTTGLSRKTELDSLLIVSDGHITHTVSKDQNYIPVPNSACMNWLLGRSYMSMDTDPQAH